MNITLPNDGIFQRKAVFKRLLWEEDSQFISADLEISYYDNEENPLPQIPKKQYSLSATGGNFRDEKGQSIVLEVDEKGLSIIPENGVSEFDYFKSINNLAIQIQGIIQAQIEEKIKENKI